MEQKSDSQQWDDLLEQTFGTAGKSEEAFSASAPQPRKRPFYRTRRFWLTLAAFLLVVIGASLWFLPKKNQPEETLSPEDAHMEEALELCKNALARWQAQETYHMNVSYLHYGDTTGGLSEADFWRSGEDFLYISMSYQIDYDLVVGFLQQDDTLYTASAGNNRNDNSSYSGTWKVSDPNEIQGSMLTPWPMVFDWDTSQIKGKSIYKTNSGFSSVSFAVLSEQSVYGAMAPYHVNFTFAEDETLESVTVVYTNPGEGADTPSTVITFRMGTETTSEIEMKVGTALQMPLTAPIPPRINRTDPA